MLIISYAQAQIGDYEARVEVNGNGFAHYTTIYFDDESWDPQASPTYGWDACCDALLILGNPNQPQVFTEVVAPPEPTNNHRLSVNGLPHLFEETNVPLGFLPGTLAPYVFTFKNLYTLPQGTVVELEDLSLNVTQDLMADSTYDTWGAPSDDESRFIIRFFPSNVTGSEDIVRNNHSEQITNTAGIVEIHGASNNRVYDLQIYNLRGQAVLQKNLFGARSFSVNVNLLSSGLYVVSLADGEGFAIRRKVILY